MLNHLSNSLIVGLKGIVKTKKINWENQLN